MLVECFIPQKLVNQQLGANSKSPFFAKFYCKFATLLHFFSFIALRALKMTISTSVWGAQHPNSGRNIQQPESPSPYNHGGNQQP